MPLNCLLSSSLTYKEVRFWCVLFYPGFKGLNARISQLLFFAVSSLGNAALKSVCLFVGFSQKRQSHRCFCASDSIPNMERQLPWLDSHSNGPDLRGGVASRYPKSIYSAYPHLLLWIFNCELKLFMLPRFSQWKVYFHKKISQLKRKQREGREDLSSGHKFSSFVTSPGRSSYPFS